MIHCMDPSAVARALAPDEHATAESLTMAPKPLEDEVAMEEARKPAKMPKVDNLDPMDMQLPGEHVHVDGDISTRKITIVRLSGAVAFGPRELDSSFTIGVLKA